MPLSKVLNSLKTGISSVDGSTLGFHVESKIFILTALMNMGNEYLSGVIPLKAAPRRVISYLGEITKLSMKLRKFK